MDAERFDQIARSLVSLSTRRGLLAFLVALPLLGGPATRRGGHEARAQGAGAGIGGNRRKHKNRTAHKHRANKKAREPRRRHNHKPCKADSTAETCAEKCGSVLNNCKKTIDCGSCDCDPACPVCQICEDVPPTCVPNAAVMGEACGDGQVCQADGSCACDSSSCGDCRTCAGDGTCQACSGCCQDGQCVDDCGCGVACCDNVCCASTQVCQDDACCTRDCLAVACGSGAPETCGVANCGACDGGQACIGGTCALVCDDGSCPQGCDCLASPSGSPICVGAIGSACTGFCQSDADCCPGEVCAAHPFACNGQFVCYVLGDPCQSP